MGNVDIVLGVQWLNTQGRILFDFRKRTIKSMYLGKIYVLRGAGVQLKSAKAKNLVKKEGAHVQFFMMSLVTNRMKTFNATVYRLCQVLTLCKTSSTNKPVLLYF